MPEPLVHKFVGLLLFGALLLSACSAIPASPAPVSPTATGAPIVVPTTAVPDPTDSPSDPGACGYQWAYQDLPELSSSFQQSLQALQPEAQATAFAFGENCILSDGTVDRFIPMETDFNITLQVGDLADESDLGGWIVKVMQVVISIPPEHILGPRPGRINLAFESGDDQKTITFYINQYQELPAGLSNAEIFQKLQSLQ